MIEVMIVVAIVAILASVMLPTYNEQVRKSRRTDAQRELVEYAQALERWFTTNGSYRNEDGACGVAYGGTNTIYSIEGECGVTTFTITATPNSDTSQAADGDLTLTQAGARGGSRDNGRWRN